VASIIYVGEDDQHDEPLGYTPISNVVGSLDYFTQYIILHDVYYYNMSESLAFNIPSSWFIPLTAGQVFVYSISDMYAPTVYNIYYLQVLVDCIGAPFFSYADYAVSRYTGDHYSGLTDTWEFSAVDTEGNGTDQTGVVNWLKPSPIVCQRGTLGNFTGKIPSGWIDIRNQWPPA